MLPQIPTQPTIPHPNPYPALPYRCVKKTSRSIHETWNVTGSDTASSRKRDAAERARTAPSRPSRSGRKRGQFVRARSRRAVGPEVWRHTLARTAERFAGGYGYVGHTGQRAAATDVIPGYAHSLRLAWCDAQRSDKNFSLFSPRWQLARTTLA